MAKLSDKEKIEYLKERLEDVFEEKPLLMVEETIWEILDLTPKNIDEAEEEFRHALEVLYEFTFYEEPKKLYKDMMSQ